MKLFVGVGGVLAFAVASGVLGLCWLLRGYGLELSDEGTLLAQIGRVAAGEVPYRDFHTGYTPGVFWVNAMLLRGLGHDIASVRIGLAVVHATAAALLWSVASRSLNRGMATAVVVVVWGCLRPVAPGAFCLFNVPYPSWYAELASLVGLHALLARRPVMAGVAWGLAFAVKQNVGAFGLGASVMALAFADGPARSRVMGSVLAAMATTATALVLGREVDTTAAVALGVPIALLAAQLVRHGAVASIGGDAARLVGGFAIIAVPLLANIVTTAGTEAVFRDILQIGTDTMSVYAAPYPTWTGTVTAVGAATSWTTALRVASEYGWLLLLPIVHTMASLLMRPGSGVQPVLTCLQAFAYLQMHPRADFWHVAPLAGASIVLALNLIWAWSRRGARIVAVLLVVVGVGRFAPTLAVLAQVVRPVPPSSIVVPSANDIRWDLLEAEHLRAIPAVTARVAGAASLVGFPAVGLFNFLTAAPSPIPHDYFFPGRPTSAETPRIVAALVAARGTMAIVLDAPIAFFPAAIGAHPSIVETFTTHYREVERIGPYRVLAHRDTR